MESLTIEEIEILQTRIGTYIFEAEGRFDKDGEEEELNNLYEKLERMKAAQQLRAVDGGDAGDSKGDGE